MGKLKGNGLLGKWMMTDNETRKGIEEPRAECILEDTGESIQLPN